MEWIEDTENYIYADVPGAYLCVYRFDRCWVWKAFFPVIEPIEGHRCTREDAMSAAEECYDSWVEDARGRNDVILDHIAVFPIGQAADPSTDMDLIVGC